MQIFENFSLKSYNTFGIGAFARYYAVCSSIDDIVEVISSGKYKGMPFLILGGGSNILFTKDFEGLVIKPDLHGFKVKQLPDYLIRVKVQAGEYWDEFVKYAVENGYGGIENLSLIPGTVGSCPIQNIGAYGSEVRETIENVEILNLETLKTSYLSNSECQFGYRDSIFKHKLQNKVVIISVSFNLSLKPVFITNYSHIEEELRRYPEINLKSIREAIIAIRKRKLPDPSEIGNAGSFFKNPVISRHKAKDIMKDYRDLPCFPQTDGMIKVPAAWLIERCGWKGKRLGNAGVHQDQPLVLVNHGDANGNEIIELAGMIRKSVLKKFGIWLDFEVNII